MTESSSFRSCANPECGQTMRGKRRDARYCSRKCANRFHYLQDRAHLHTYEGPVIRCANSTCGQWFQAYRSTQKFCSERCYRKVRYARHKDQHQAYRDAHRDQRRNGWQAWYSERSSSDPWYARDRERERRRRQLKMEDVA